MLQELTLGEISGDTDMPCKGCTKVLQVKLFRQLHARLLKLLCHCKVYLFRDLGEV